jgi:hypothetical protein
VCTDLADAKAPGFALMSDGMRWEFAFARQLKHAPRLKVQKRGDHVLVDEQLKPLRSVGLPRR